MIYSFYVEKQIFCVMFYRHMKKPEILSPIQDFMSLKAAIDAGADAVYFGVRGYNMRVTAKNFTVEDLQKISETAHEKGVKTYLALNKIGRAHV